MAPQILEDKKPLATQAGLADASLLAKVDKLFACGVGEQVNLPQIVVVGDQSSGKSSVLEGLVCKAFPRDSGLCTRFATQLIFKRAAEEKISVSIIPDANADPEFRARLDGWKRTDLKSLDGEVFVNIMKEVHDILGLAKPGEQASDKSTFSDSVLRLEIAGPTQEHLSVIDVPGIFKSTTPGLTTKTDIALVRNMVLRYMDNPRSVMLAVIPANVDVATQEILELAHDVDPEGNRTLGILTKPDLVDKGAEQRVLDMIEGRTWVMQLGWHLVRNPGQKELNNDSAVDRLRLEYDFFRNTVPWNDVDKTMVGVENLRHKLKEVLSGLVRREFPKVKNDILKRLASKQKSLKDLGPERSSTASQTTHLTDLSVQFQQLIARAVDGRFVDDLHNQSDTSALQLSTIVTQRMTAFSNDIAAHGHLYPFIKINPTNGLVDGEKTLHEKPEAGTYTRLLNDQDGELSDVLIPSAVIRGRTTGDIMKWLKDIHAKSRGFELGTFQPAILAQIMRKQASNWKALSLGFISDVIIQVHQCIKAALESLTTDEALLRALLDALSEGLLQRYALAVRQVEFINKVELDNPPFTINHYFNDNLQKLRQDRITKQMKEAASTTNQAQGPFLLLDDAIRSHPMSNAEHTIQDIHDILFSYYKVARKRFVDNVAQQAAFHYLLNGDDNPLTLFSPSFVSRLSPGELDSIAGEDPRVMRQRAQLEKEIASLLEAKSILSKG